MGRISRKDKYPDTKTFHFYNANPRNRITGDCVTRALCTALDMPYNECVMEQAECQCKTGYDNADPKGIDKYLQSKGWVKMPQPRKEDGTKYTGKEFCYELRSYDSSLGKNVDFDFRIDRVVANIGGHHTVAIVEGMIYDIWNSENKCIGNFWVKKS